MTVSDLNNGPTPASLAASLLGGGVSISNVVFTGDSRGAGTFTGAAPIIGFDQGIILDSGKVQTLAGDPSCSRGVEGPNTCFEPASDNATDFTTPGDPDLTALAGYPTSDAAILEFDFNPQFSNLQFKFVFASEEYSDYSNTVFNDAFGLFVNNQNCALVPGTNLPIDVNSINAGNDAGGDPTPHSPQFFRDNVHPAPSIDSEMDGLTTVLTCSATVNPGQTNHMKLAISDASDGVLDSAIFIAAGSLTSGTTVTTSLSGGGQTGTAITVGSGTSVTDSATLSGQNAATATGTVTYKVFSDPTCSTVFADAGTKPVSSGVAAPSTAVAFNSAGTYYWQAFYSGDGVNGAGSSPCGDETVTVTGGSGADGCHLTGNATTREWKVEDILSSDLTAPQKLTLRHLTTSSRLFRLTSLTAAACSDDPSLVPGQGETMDTLTADGIGTWMGKPGYLIHITLTDGGESGTGSGAALDRVAFTITSPAGLQVVRSDQLVTSGNQDAADGD